MMDPKESLSRNQILAMLNQHKDKLQELGAVKIGLFGSQVRGDAKPDSDIDILVTLKDHTFDTYCDVLFYLEDLFERKVDLVPEGQLKPRIRPYILSEVI